MYKEGQILEGSSFQTLSLIGDSPGEANPCGTPFPGPLLTRSEKALRSALKGIIGPCLALGLGG